MWVAWLVLAVAAMVHRRHDRAAIAALGLIALGLLAIQPVKMVLDHEPEKVAVAMVWIVTSCLILTVKGGKFWRVSLYLAATVPCVLIARVLPVSYGPANPGVILSHVLGTLAILEAGYGIGDRVGGWRMGIGNWAGRFGRHMGSLGGEKEGT